MGEGQGSNPEVQLPSLTTSPSHCLFFAHLLLPTCAAVSSSHFLFKRASCLRAGWEARVCVVRTAGSQALTGASEGYDIEFPHLLCLVELSVAAGMMGTRPLSSGAWYSLLGSTHPKSPRPSKPILSFDSSLDHLPAGLPDQAIPLIS